MKRIFFLLSINMVGIGLKAQKVDSLFFNLYTDSLKKGVHNYINVDGKLSNGQWLPLTEKHLMFTATAGVFEGNSLLIDTSYKGEKIIVKAILRSNTEISKEITIYIKKNTSTERLKTIEELLREPSGKNKPTKKAFVNSRMP
ncbi:MAG: hypothetical protein ACKVOW_05765 [Chitinophagaceae bacterium]